MDGRELQVTLQLLDAYVGARLTVEPGNVKSEHAVLQTYGVLLAHLRTAAQPVAWVNPESLAWLANAGDKAAVQTFLYKVAEGDTTVPLYLKGE
jgi:hypothetical protein